MARLHILLPGCHPEKRCVLPVSETETCVVLSTYPRLTCFLSRPLILNLLAGQQPRQGRRCLAGAGGRPRSLCPPCRLTLGGPEPLAGGSAECHAFSSQLLTSLCFSCFYFRKLRPLQMALPGRAPGCCPLGKATPHTPSSGLATSPSLSSTKVPRAGSRTLSLPLPSLGRSDSEPRQLRRLLRGASHLCGVWPKPASQINSVDRREQLRPPSSQPPTDPR